MLFRNENMEYRIYQADNPAGRDAVFPDYEILSRFRYRISHRSGQEIRGVYRALQWIVAHQRIHSSKLPAGLSLLKSWQTIVHYNS